MSIIELPVIGSLCLRKDFWDFIRQTFQLAREKCMAKGYFDVQKTVSMTDHRFFVVVLSELGVGYIDTRIAQGFVQTVVKYVVKSND